MSEAGDETSPSAVTPDEEQQQESETASSADHPDDEWMDILDNGQLLKRIIHAGDLSKGRPERGNRVAIKLTTRIRSSGSVVASETFERVEAFVGDYDVIHGVDLLLPMMNEGEVAQVVINERFAFGAEGKEPDVPPHCTLDCEIQLLEVQRIDSETVFDLNDRINTGAYNQLPFHVLTL
jgi:FK506-binding protein 8